MKVKKKKSKSTSSDSSAKSSKKSKAEIKAAKKKARLGDGSFPDLLIVTKEKSSKERIAEGLPDFWFMGHDGTTMDTLYKDAQVVGVYKLRRASKMKIVRKVER